MKLEPGVMFIWGYMIAFFPIQCLFYIVGKFKSKYHTWWDNGPYKYLQDDVVPMLKSMQGYFDIKTDYARTKRKASKV